MKWARRISVALLALTCVATLLLPALATFDYAKQFRNTPNDRPSDVEPKPPWRERKEQYIQHLKTASDDALLVSIADKLHNARAILADYRQLGDDLWPRFNASKKDQLWYYGALVKVFKERRPKDALVEEFGRVVEELQKETGAR